MLAYECRSRVAYLSPRRKQQKAERIVSTSIIFSHGSGTWQLLHKSEQSRWHGLKDQNARSIPSRRIGHHKSRIRFRPWSSCEYLKESYCRGWPRTPLAYTPRPSTACVRLCQHSCSSERCGSRTLTLSRCIVSSRYPASKENSLANFIEPDAYIIFLSVLALIIVYPQGNLRAVDAYFFGASASTESGLNTFVSRFPKRYVAIRLTPCRIDVKELKTYQQVYLYIIPILGNLGFVNILVVLVRLRWFKKRFETVGKTPSRCKLQAVFTD